MYKITSKITMQDKIRPGADRKKEAETENLCCRIKVDNKRYLQQRAKETGLTVTEVLEAIIETFIDEHK